MIENQKDKIENKKPSRRGSKKGKRKNAIHRLNLPKKFAALKYKRRHAYYYYRYIFGRSLFGRDEYSLVLHEMLLVIQEKLIEGKAVKIPQLGRFQVLGNYRDYIGNIIDPSFPRMKLKIDVKRTMELWRKEYNRPKGSIRCFTDIEGKPLVYLTNEHSDGYVFGLKWSKVRGLKNKHLQFYKFLTTQAIKIGIRDAVYSNDYSRYELKLDKYGQYTKDGKRRNFAEEKKNKKKDKNSWL